MNSKIAAYQIEHAPVDLLFKGLLILIPENPVPVFPFWQGKHSISFPIMVACCNSDIFYYLQPNYWRYEWKLSANLCS